MAEMWQWVGRDNAEWERGWGEKDGRRLILWPGFERDQRASIGLSSTADGARIKVFARAWGCCAAATARGP